MNDSSNNLLNMEDLATLDSTVFPLEARQDLVREGPHGSILFTERGVRLYTAAFRRAGIAVNWAAIRTRSDLHAMVMAASAALCAEADAGMRRELDAGRISVQRRESVRAYPDGSVSEFMAATERWEICAPAGKNVIPIGLERKKAQGTTS